MKKSMIHSQRISFLTLRRAGAATPRRQRRNITCSQWKPSNYTKTPATAPATAGTGSSSASSFLFLATGLALSKKTTTFCSTASPSWQAHSPREEQQSSSTATATATSVHPKDHSVVDLIIPSLQALLRVIRLLQTTSLIVMDYEVYKWQQKAVRFIEQYYDTNNDDDSFRSGTTSKNTTDHDHHHHHHGDDIDLSNLSKKQLQKYWEQEVKRRQEIFEQAQIAYTTPLTTKQQQNENDDNNNNMTYDEITQQQKLKMKQAAAEWVQAEDILKEMGGSKLSQIHTHAAQRLVQLCRTNAGVYIKIGQHIANLDYIIPQEYIDILSCLLDDAPTSSYDEVCTVIKEDLGKTPNELFHNFETIPIASASLAQVHVAYDKNNPKRKLAIKVQHRGLRETCRGDLVALTTVIHALEFFLEDFNFGWIADEIAPQLPLELDFHNEGKNAEKAMSYIQKRRDDEDVIIPKIIWENTTSRVLCMEFEEGFRATDVEAIRKANLKPRDVSKLISRVFHSQTFLDAWVHCDPHPANVLLRASPKTGKPQMVLVDHGLYKQLEDDFRVTYAELWKALMMADIPTIKRSCSALGVDGKLYTLLSGLLTARPFDEVVERSKTGSFDLSAKSKVQHKSQQDKAVIRGYAQKFLLDILTMIDNLPRQMVLLLKMNDCLRHIDYALGSPTNNIVVAGRLAAQAVYEHQLAAPHIRPWQKARAWLDYMIVIFRIQIYDLGAWWMELRRSSTLQS